MSDSKSDKTLEYYTKELSYLRNAGALFAKEHPKIARRLQISENESPDPHVERLLESFAFLTGRISQEIDNRMPEMAAAMLGILYPSLVNPIPSATILHIKADPTKGKLTAGYSIPRGTSVTALGDEDVPCRFQTAYDVTLWPFEVSEVSVKPRLDVPLKAFDSIESKFFLHLRLQTKDVLFENINLNEIQFHIFGDRPLALSILEDVLSAPQNCIYVRSFEKEAVKIEEALSPVGFERDELILPQSPYSLSAYGLVQEYFNFPEKFLFFKIKNLENIKSQIDLETTALDFYIPLRDGMGLTSKSIGPGNFLLGCAPIVNVFKRTTDPIRIDHQKTFYRLVPDQRRDRTTEVHSVLNVSGTYEGGGDFEIKPYFSLNHGERGDSQGVFWISKVQSAEDRGLPGTDTYLSFVDLDFSPLFPPEQIAYASVLCTNRYLAEQIPVNGSFQFEDKSPTSTIKCLYKPTGQVHGPHQGETLWKMVSGLSLSHLYLSGREGALESLKETMRLYGGRLNNPHLSDLDLIKSMAINPITRRIHGPEVWRGFIEGLEVNLTVAAKPLTGSPLFLFSMVLQRFLSLLTTVNSFVELNLKSEHEIGNWMRWQLHFGVKNKL